jgi:hypothetical protein
MNVSHWIFLKNLTLPSSKERGRKRKCKITDLKINTYPKKSSLLGRI